MPADYYSGPDGAGTTSFNPPAEAAPADPGDQNAAEDTADADENPEEQDAGETFLIPKSAFQGKDYQPGQKETVEVVHVYEDEVEVKCVPAGGDDNAQGGDSPAMSSALGGLEAAGS